MVGSSTRKQQIKLPFRLCFETVELVGQRRGVNAGIQVLEKSESEVCECVVMGEVETMRARFVPSQSLSFNFLSFNHPFPQLELSQNPSPSLSSVMNPYRSSL